MYLLGLANACTKMQHQQITLSPKTYPQAADCVAMWAYGVHCLLMHHTSLLSTPSPLALHHKQHTCQLHLHCVFTDGQDPKYHWMGLLQRSQQHQVEQPIAAQFAAGLGVAAARPGVACEQALLLLLLPPLKC